ncbi:MAG: acyl--CoA ligase, partial [Nitrospirae bacterium]|nr:acyl--CoA ligase [Nitrospirota bacterium]
MTAATEHDRILRAHEMGGPPFSLPWHSFGEDRRIHCRYGYAEFGDLVGRAATVMRDRLGLRRGDRIATVLFNHDQTVLVYFAAWTLGLAVVPINVEESTEKKRYILEHSEASVAFCWQDCVDEVRSLQGDLPRLREVVVVGEENRQGRLLSELLAEARPAASVSEGSLEDEALIVYTSGTTGPPKGVVLTARNLLVDADGIAEWHG